MNKTRTDAFVFLTVLFFLQNMLTYIFPVGLPSFLAIAVVFYALYEGPVFGMVAGCYVGFFLDLFGVGPLGLEMANLAFVGVLSGFAASKLFRESVASKVLLPVFGDTWLAAANLFFYKISMDQEILSTDIFREVFPAARLILTAAVSPFIFSILKKVSYPQEKRRAAAFIMRN